MTSVIERYYTQWYVLGVSPDAVPPPQSDESKALEAEFAALHAGGGRPPGVRGRFRSSKMLADAEEGDSYVHVHSNSVAAVGLAPGHPIIKQRKVVTAVRFDLFHSVGNVKVKGKRQKGGVFLLRGMPICLIVCSDGSRYLVRSHVHAKLIGAKTAAMDGRR
eukprot:NODE_2252_length_1103_cov_40.322746_g2234_i0.p2 GENE.NODE_2252_length_1103_cov_40.322746_g2234_i0~~NODE_2252_length_1103_cov_40.322746_g2234_i0.p2  ORF type:complete len:162 (-),score=44.12 NODE_2252_length_1103_cov_40.322746_g2234_i0:534-1019(-)